MSDPTLKDRLAKEGFVGLAVSADFYPEDTPKGFVNITLAVPEGVAFGSGLFEVRYLRPLTDHERGVNQYTAISRVNEARKGSSQ